MKSRKSALSIGLIILLVACQSGQTPPPPKLAISPKTTTFTAGGTAQNFTATFTGTSSSSTINWTLSPNIGTLNASTGATVSYTPPLTVNSSTAVTLTATSGNLSDTATLTVSPSPTITVTGKVIQLIGLPLPNVQVAIGNQTPVTTDANGNFSISGITPPYDVKAVYAPLKLGVVYKGLSRPDPTIMFTGTYPGITPYPGGTSLARLSGTVSGGAGFPQPKDYYTFVIFASQHALGGFGINSTTGSYGGPFDLVRWHKTSTVTGSSCALQYQMDSSSLPIHYSGYGCSGNVTLTNGAQLTGQDIVMNSLADTSLSGNISVPTGYNVTLKQVWADFTNTISWFQLVAQADSVTGFNYVIPNLPNISFQVSAWAVNSASSVTGYITGLAPNTSNISIALPAGPELRQPAKGATGVNAATLFSWTPFSGGVHLAVMKSAAANYFILTSDTNTTLPDLSALGLGLPSSAVFTWQVDAYGPFASVDQAAAPAGLPFGWPIGDGMPTDPGNVYLGASNPSTFTTAP